MFDRLKAHWIVGVMRDQWHTWLQHLAVGALAMGTDLRLETSPYGILLVGLVMLARETRDLISHRKKGTPAAHYQLDYILDWVTVLLGIAWGAWIAGAL